MTAEHAAAVQTTLHNVRKARAALESVMLSSAYGSATEGDEQHLAQEQLTYCIREAFCFFAMLAENLRMSATCEWIRTVAHLHEVSGEITRHKFRPTDIGEWVESRAIDDVEAMAASLLRLLGSVQESGRELERLLTFLRRTAVIVKNTGVTPTSEHDIQRVMHPRRNDAFDSFTKSVSLPKPIQDFKPDSGVADLSTAIEFKYVTKEEELKTAFRGVVEDLSGYTKSKDWTNFVAVIYLTEPFETEERFHKGLQVTGSGDRWATIFVHGPGSRKTKEKKDKRPRAKSSTSTDDRREHGGGD